MALLDLATGSLAGRSGRGCDAARAECRRRRALAAAAGGNAGPIAIRFPVFNDGRGISLARAAARAARLQGRDQGGRPSDPRPCASSCCARASTPPRSPIPSRPRRGRRRCRASSTITSRATATSCRCAGTPRARRPSALDQRLTRVKSLTDRIREMRRRIEGRIVFSTSLGLEDQAILHAIAESGADIDIFTLDTGRLFPEVLETVELSELRYGVRIRLVAPEAERGRAAGRPRRRVRLPPLGREPQDLLRDSQSAAAQPRA